MTLTEYINYFKTAAQNHKDILHVDGSDEHFIKINVQEVISKIKTTIKFPVVAIEMPEIGTVDQLSDNVRDLFEGAFVILKPANLTDYDAQFTVISECLEICNDFRSKMVNDRRKNILKHLDVNSFRFSEVGPVYNNLFGYRLDFRLNEPANVFLDEDKWNDETKFSI